MIFGRVAETLFGLGASIGEPQTEDVTGDVETDPALDGIEIPDPDGGLATPPPVDPGTTGNSGDPEDTENN